LRSLRGRFAAPLAGRPSARRRRAGTSLGFASPRGRFAAPLAGARTKLACGAALLTRVLALTLLAAGALCWMLGPAAPPPRAVVAEPSEVAPAEAEIAAPKPAEVAPRKRGAVALAETREAARAKAVEIARAESPAARPEPSAGREEGDPAEAALDDPGQGFGEAALIDSEQGFDAELDDPQRPFVDGPEAEEGPVIEEPSLAEPEPSDTALATEDGSTEPGPAEPEFPDPWVTEPEPAEPEFPDSGPSEPAEPAPIETAPDPWAALVRRMLAVYARIGAHE
jgi:hypothetical protein